MKQAGPTPMKRLHRWFHGWLSGLGLGLGLGWVPVHAADFVVSGGPPRRVIAADYQARRLGEVDASGQLLWQIPIQDIHDLSILPDGHILTQTSWTRIVELDRDHRVVWSYDAASMNGNAGKKVEVHAFQRLPDGLTMIAESGPGRIIEVDREGRIRREVPLQRNRPDAHRDTRLVRKLDDGHYLVCHEAESAVREYDGSGRVVWSYPVTSATGQPAAVYSASRLPGGTTLVGAGNGHRVVEVDRAGKVVWSLEEKEIPGVTLAWVTLTERLPNGNTLVVNCHAGPDQPQLLEITPDKKVAWSLKDFRNFGNALPIARLRNP